VDWNTIITMPAGMGYWYPKLRILLYFLNANDNYLLPFSYGTDVEPLTYFEALEAIALGLKTQTMTLENESLDKFLSEMLESAYTMTLLSQSSIDGSRSNMLSNRIQNLERKYSGPEWAQLQLMCEATKAGKPFPRNISLHEIKEAPTMGQAYSLMNDDYPGTNSRTVGNGITIFARGYYAFSYPLVEEMEWLRLDLFPMLRHYKILQEITEARGIKTPILSGKMDFIKNQIKTYLELLNRRRKEFYSCYYDLATAERDRMGQVLIYEKEYWKAVHREMKKLQQNPSYVSPLNKEPLPYSLPAGIQWRSRINAKSTVTYEFDIFLRIKAYIENGSIGGSKLPAIDKAVEIEFSKALAKDDFYQKSESRPIAFLENEDEFANSAMRSAGFSNQNLDFYWYQIYSISLPNMRNLFDGYALMLRLNSQVGEILGMEPLITTEEVVELPIIVNKFLNLTPNEAIGLKTIGLISRWDVKLNRLFKDELDQYRPTHEYLIKSITKKYMGAFGHEDVYENAMMGQVMPRPRELIVMQKTAYDLSVHRLSSETDLFGIGSNFKEFIDKKFIDYVKRDLQVAKDFQTAVAEREKNIKPDELVRRIRIDEPASQAEISGPGLLKEVDAYTLEFHKQTGNFFK
jgi:hypothetical protein